KKGVIDVDIRDNPDCMPCGLNLSEACARTSCMIGIFNSIDHSVPKNAGSFRRINLHLREGCIVGIPEHPTSCSVATTNVADRVANSVQCAMAEIGEGMGMAEAGSVISPSAGVISGTDPRNGKPYVNQVFLGFTGGAAGPQADAWLTIGHVGNAGLCYQDSIEQDELYQPIHVNTRHIIQDSEGAGTFRGAPGFYVEFGPQGGPFEIGYVSDGAINNAKGVREGGNARGADQYLKKSDGSTEQLDPCAQVVVKDGDKIVSISCGGGGYGSPLKRNPQMVLKDVSEGWISKERAASVYGVVINDSGELDEDASQNLRTSST
ncbi:MAG: hydantoinase B/oxoprolinase family protein, partial [Gammaproteobacteria bacterium]|nr:hydantoinase B/oxoprolinase family protein [Gammaproteobacteria bacterium]